MRLALLALVAASSAHAFDVVELRANRRVVEKRIDACAETYKLACITAMSTEHENRLTAVNRQLVLDLNAARALLRRMLDPEDLGHAVSEEARGEIAKLVPAPSK